MRGTGGEESLEGFLPPHYIGLSQDDRGLEEGKRINLGGGT